MDLPGVHIHLMLPVAFGGLILLKLLLVLGLISCRLFRKRSFRFIGYLLPHRSDDLANLSNSESRVLLDHIWSNGVSPHEEGRQSTLRCILILRLLCSLSEGVLNLKDLFHIKVLCGGHFT